MNRLILVACLSLFSMPAQAQTPDYMSGNFFLPVCKSMIADSIPHNADIMGIGRCSGIIQTLMVTGEYYQSDRRYCVPTGVTIKQAAQVVINYMERNPQHSHLYFVALAQVALRAAWPCR